MQVARVGIVILLLAGATGAASDFLTEGVDNARTGWVRDEKVFTTANVGSMKLLWKLKLESKPRAMHSSAQLLYGRDDDKAGALRRGAPAFAQLARKMLKVRGR